MRAWRRAHPNATVVQVDAKAAHIEALGDVGSKPLGTPDTEDTDVADENLTTPPPSGVSLA